jgi:hypothetical protein
MTNPAVFALPKVVGTTGVGTMMAPSSSLSPKVVAASQVLPSLVTSTTSPRSCLLSCGADTPKAAAITLPEHIAALNGRWDGECSIHGDHNNSVDSEKANVWLGCHLAFAPLDGVLTIEHAHNTAALCYANIRLRGHGHSIGSDGTSRRLIPFSLNGLLDGSSGAFELTVSSTQGEYQNSLTSHGTIDFANRSLLADCKGRTGTLRLAFSSDPSNITSTLRPHVSPKTAAKQLGLMSSAECGSGRPRSGAVLAKVITPAIAPCTPPQTPTPGTTTGPDPLTGLTTKEGAVRVWEGKLVRHGTEHTAILSECVLAFSVANDIGTIIGTGMASWEGYRVPFTVEGSFDHKHRVTVVWADVCVKLMTEPPQAEKYTVSIDVAQRRIEGHNAYGRLKLEPSSSTGMPSMPPPPYLSPNSTSGNPSGDVNEATIDQSGMATTLTPPPSSMSQSQMSYMNANTGNTDAQYGYYGNMAAGQGYGNQGGGGGGMMYGPQMTPQGITYTLMPTAMAMQAHASAAQMIYGSQSNNGNYPPYGTGTSGAVYSPSSTDANAMSVDAGTDTAATTTTASMNASTTSDTNSNTSGGRSRSGSLGSSSSSPPSSGPTSPLISAAVNTTDTAAMITSDSSSSSSPSLSPSSSSSTSPLLPSVDDSINSGGMRPRRYSITATGTPRSRSGSDAANAPLQQFEIGDRVYMYTLPSNIVQSVLLRGPITAQAFRDSPYPYSSPRQLHFNPGVLTRSENSNKRGSGGGTVGGRRGSQPNRASPQAAMKSPDRRSTTGSGIAPNTTATSSTTNTTLSQQTNAGGTGGNSTQLQQVLPHPSSPPPSVSSQQARIVGASSSLNAAGGKKVHKWSAAGPKMRGGSGNTPPGGPSQLG